MYKTNTFSRFLCFAHAENLLQGHNEVTGLLPSHKITSKPSYVHWGRRSDGVETILRLLTPRKMK